MKETDAGVVNHLGYKMELRQEIKQLMADSLNLSVEQLIDDTDIRTLEKDSIDIFEMICEIEDRYGINIPNDDFKDYVIVKDAITKIENLVLAK
jgi:acyl carrier protein